jgi:heparanase 1
MMQKGITILLINLDNSTTIQAKVAFNSSWSLPHKARAHKKSIYQLLGDYESESTREEYHLTAKDGNLHSQTVLLNGKTLTVNSSGDIPSLEPLYANSSNLIKVDPFSIVFAHIPNLVLPACM